MKKATALLALMVFMMTGTAFAAGTTNATKGAGTTNSSKSEAKAPKFEECDKDKDDALTLEEFTACYPHMAEKFAAMDANSDGKVTKDEVKAYRAEHKQEKATKHTGKNATKKEAPAQ